MLRDLVKKSRHKKGVGDPRQAEAELQALAEMYVEKEQAYKKAQAERNDVKFKLMAALKKANLASFETADAIISLVTSRNRRASKKLIVEAFGEERGEAFWNDIEPSESEWLSIEEKE